MFRLKDKDLLAFAVLRHALGGWSTIKWTPGNSPLASSVSQFFTQPIFVSALHAAHADAGLFGVTVSAPASQVKAVLVSAASILFEGKISNDAIERGRNQLKNEILQAAQNGEELVHHIGNQILLHSGQYKSPDELVADIDKVSSVEVTGVCIYLFVLPSHGITVYLVLFYTVCLFFKFYYIIFYQSQTCELLRQI